MPDSGFKVHAMELGPMENFVYLVEDLASRRSLPHASPQDAAAIAPSHRGHPKGRLAAT